MPPTEDVPDQPGPGWPGIPRDGVELALVTRSGFVESRHHGHAVVTAPDGHVVTALGQADATMDPRSSLKPLQAAGCLLVGADLHGPALAIGAGSHRGHPDHLDLVAEVLAASGLDEDDLQCPPALPSEPWASEDLLRAGGGPRRLAMNCSGKHAAMLTACRAGDLDRATHLEPDHPLQQRIRGVVEQVTGVTAGTVGIDGCGAPLFATSLVGLARAIGRVGAAGAGEPGPTAGLHEEVVDALGRVARAMRAHPWAVAGIGADDTMVMEQLDGVVAKGGAEGVLALGTADGFGVAVKIADGSSRATVPVGLALLTAAGIDATDLADALAPRTLGGGLPVGRVHAAPGVTA
nr:asparaginase [Salsipaludibacter albus]